MKLDELVRDRVEAAVRVGLEQRIEDSQPDAESDDAQGADQEKNEQDSPAGQLEQRVTRDRSGAVHRVCPSSMNEGS